MKLTDTQERPSLIAVATSSSSLARAPARQKWSRAASCSCSRLASRTTLLPRNIIAFTFTDKAAAELKERIVTPDPRVAR